MLRDILADDPQVAAVVTLLTRVDADVLILGGVDWDREGAGLAALNARLGYAHAFATKPNRGVPSRLDLDGDGRMDEPEDAIGFARFTGQEGLAVLSRLPLHLRADLGATAWGDVAGGLGPPDPALAVLPVSTTAHWVLDVAAPDAPFSLLVWHATPPVFDGPEDRNGRRNHDEAALWLPVIEATEGALLVAGFANLDPIDGDGRPEALSRLLSHPRLTDPAPRSDGGARASTAQGGANARHKGAPDLDTVDWSDADTGPGNLRTDYLLPSRELAVLDAGVLWPAPGDPLLPTVETASRHRVVWVDLTPAPH